MILKENKSSGKAHELLGLIKEKEQAYVDAAQSYEKAFELTKKKSASIGYRLAYNYMKGKRYVDCL
jgi:tetratricopeptide repeat protein 21B